MMSSDQQAQKTNKAIVVRFNKAVIEQGDETAFRELMAPDFVNRTAAPGMSTGADGMLFMLNQVLRPAFPDLTVEIHDQIAEDDKVTTRKTLHGTHRGALFGIPPTNRRIDIQVIDIVRLRDGQYVEHWGINTLAGLLAQLRGT
jgi:steroid delta-isomerase-like uncharacterized protein